MNKLSSFPRSAWERTAATLCVALATLLTLILTASAGQPTPKRLPLPKDDALQKAGALIKELYGKEANDAGKDRDLLLKLARTFLYEAKDTNDDTAGKYVLLGEAAQMAVMSGDSTLALQALDEIVAAFDIPPAEALRFKVNALVGCCNADAPAEVHQTTIEAIRAVQDEAAASDNFDDALRLGIGAEMAAKKLKSVPLVSAIRKHNGEIETQAHEYAKVKPFVDALAKDPKDAKANLQVGIYYALVKGQWDKGLPRLAAGGDNPLSSAARLEIGHKGTWADCKRVGEAWAGQAGGLQGTAKVNALLRAYHWHQQAFADPAINEKGRKEVEVAMLAVNEQLPQELRAGEIAVELKRFTGHNGPIFAVAISGDGSRIVSGGADSFVRLWDAKTGKQIRRLDGHGAPVWALAIAADGKRVLSGGFDKTVRVWNADTGTESGKVGSLDDYIRAIGFADGGKIIVAAGDDRGVYLWSKSIGAKMTGHDHSVFGVAVSRDGKRALSASLDRTVRLWDLGNNTALKVLEGHTDTVLAVTFLPDQQRALSASTDKTLRLWDLTTGQTLKVFKGHTGYVYSVAVSPDGRRALSAGQDGKVIVWDVDSGKMLRVLSGHSGAVWSVAFSGDGRWAVTGGDDGIVRLWGNAK